MPVTKAVVKTNDDCDFDRWWPDMNLPSVFISQYASTGTPGRMEENQYFLLTACPPLLALISVHVSAGSSGMDPRETENRTAIFSFY